LIQPINILTENVARELRSTASKYAMSTSQLYIELNTTKTYALKDGEDSQEIFGNDLTKYKNEEYLEDSQLNFTQEYDITIHALDDRYPFKNMICEIVFEKDETLAYLIIKKGSQLRYYDGLYHDFLNYITELKLRSNILLYLFDVDYKSSIKGFVDVIQKIKKITFNEDKKILVAQGLEAIESIKADISMLIEENNRVGKEDEEGKVDYSNRGFLLSCVEGEQLFEFIKPQQGQNGRTCKGKIIQVEEVNLHANPTFTVEDGIEVEDSFENIKYFSNKSGYLVKKGNKYDVANSIDIDEISFKTTGTINSDLDSEISINVVKQDPLEDAIEEGMHVKVQTLSVKGSIGPNTQIEARDILIDGQTHKDSFIQCHNAQIGQHRGVIEGRRVEVNTLEGGEIIADIAIVKNALRGVIKAKRIQISSLGSHVTMEASESITIEMIKGEENKFILDTNIKGAFDKNESEIDEIQYLEKLENELKPLFEMVKETTEKLKKNLIPCDKIKAALIKAKKEGSEITPTLIKNFRLCKVMKVHYKKLKEDFEYKKSQVSTLKKKLSSSKIDIFNAKITIEHPHRGYNIIIYRLHEPEREIELKTNDSMSKSTFRLIDDEEGILRIVNVK